MAGYALAVRGHLQGNIPGGAARGIVAVGTGLRFGLYIFRMMAGLTVFARILDMRGVIPVAGKPVCHRVVAAYTALGSAFATIVLLVVFDEVGVGFRPVAGAASQNRRLPGGRGNCITARSGYSLGNAHLVVAGATGYILVAGMRLVGEDHPAAFIIQKNAMG